MSDDLHHEAKSLFLKALDLAETDREAFLKQVEGEDAALADEVRSLLTFHEEEPDESVQPDLPRELAPGDLFAERYRILRLIGRGGMGEIYQANDERLGETVAIKRLVGGGQPLSDHLRNEVLLARKVTHHTICRIFDLGEHESEQYITMEYVDGEDLDSLIRRAGRLPSDRVASIAHELCVGLAAAHGRGVLHRDLKPANILIDSEGRVRITDFGIAAQAGSHSATTRAGTPSYMAPEQLIPGGTATEQSDLYSLGLVLYEMLVGKAPPSDPRARERRRSKRRGKPSLPLDLAAEVTPQLARVVLSAMDDDVSKRPASALDMAAALPGGNALGAALEARITPSPALVARAPSLDRLGARAHHSLWLLGLGLLLGGALWLGQGMDLLPGGGSLDHPAHLEHQARILLSDLDVVEALSNASRFRGFLEDPTSTATENKMLFWYREEGPPRRSLFERTILDPARSLILYSGVTAPEQGRNVVMLDGNARLVFLESTLEGPGTSVQPDWTALHAAAGINADDLRDARTFPSPVASDTSIAWTFTRDGTPDQTVQAAFLEGRPVWFSLGMSEDEAHLATSAQLERLGGFVWVRLILAALLLTALTFTVRNLRAGRADRRGAIKLLSAVAILSACQWIVLLGTLAHPQLNRTELQYSGIVMILIASVFAALFYLALEPQVRLHWPQTLIAWNRLLYGDFRNPLVGRSVLLGSVFGSAMAIIYLVDFILPNHVTSLQLTSIDQGPRLLAAMGLSESISVLLREGYDAIGRAGLALFAFSLLRTMMRRTWLAGIPFVILLAFLETNTGGHHQASLLTLGLPVALLFAWLLSRSGLLASIVAGFTFYAIRFTPITLDQSAWWSHSTILTFGTIIVLGIGAWMTTRRATRA